MDPACPGVVIVALTIVDPTAMPLTVPEALTVATATLLEAQVMVRPVADNGSPELSNRFTVRATVWPTCTLAGDGTMTAVATGSISTVTSTDAGTCAPSAPVRRRPAAWRRGAGWRRRGCCRR